MNPFRVSRSRMQFSDVQKREAAGFHLRCTRPLGHRGLCWSGSATRKRSRLGQRQPLIASRLAVTGASRGGAKTNVAKLRQDSGKVGWATEVAWVTGTHVVSLPHDPAPGPSRGSLGRSLPCALAGLCPRRTHTSCAPCVCAGGCRCPCDGRAPGSNRRDSCCENGGGERPVVDRSCRLRGSLLRCSRRNALLRGGAGARDAGGARHFKLSPGPARARNCLVWLAAGGVTQAAKAPRLNGSVRRARP